MNAKLLLQTVQDIDLALEAANIERLTAMFGGNVNAVNTAFFKIIGLISFTQYSRILSNESGKNMVMSILKYLNKTRELIELRIDHL